MNWSKILVGGVAAGIVMSVVEFVMHGVIMRSTYEGYPDVFRADASPVYFVFVAVCVAIAAAILFARSRACWGEGAKGGATYGFFVGLLAFFTFFYNPLVFEGYPYYLAWCGGSITLIAIVISGSVLGLVIKKS